MKVDDLCGLSIEMLIILDLTVSILNCLVHLEHFLAYLLNHGDHHLLWFNFHLVVDCYELVDLLDIPFAENGDPLITFCWMIHYELVMQLSSTHSLILMHVL